MNPMPPKAQCVCVTGKSPPSILCAVSVPEMLYCATGSVVHGEVPSWKNFTAHKQACGWLEELTGHGLYNRLSRIATPVFMAGHQCLLSHCV